MIIQIESGFYPCDPCNHRLITSSELNASDSHQRSYAVRLTWLAAIGPYSYCHSCTCGNQTGLVPFTSHSCGRLFRSILKSCLQSDFDTGTMRPECLRWHVAFVSFIKLWCATFVLGKILEKAARASRHVQFCAVGLELANSKHFL